MKIVILLLLSTFILGSVLAQTEASNQTTQSDSTTIQNVTLESFYLLFNGRNIYGSWTSQLKTSFLGYFDNPQGFVVLEMDKYTDTIASTYFMLNPQASNSSVNNTRILQEGPLYPDSAVFDDSDAYAQDTTTNLGTQAFVVRMSDGEYIDNKSADIIYQADSKSLIQFDNSTGTMTITNQNAQVFTKKSGIDVVSTMQCQINMTISFYDQAQNKPSNKFQLSSDDQILIRTQVQSHQCNFDIVAYSSTTQTFVPREKMYIYVGIVSFIGLLTILGSISFANSIQRKIHAFRISLGLLWLMITVDYYLLILNLILVFTYSLLMVIPCGIYIALAFYYERKAILKYFFVKDGGNEELVSQDEYRACGFYFIGLALIFILELIMILSFKFEAIHLTALIFMPQIIHNFKKNREYKPNFKLILMMGLPRIGFVFYIKLFSGNIFRLTPDILFASIYVGLVAIQILALLIQMRRPRFFTSSKKKRLSRTICDEDVCSICIGHLTFVSGCDSGMKSQLLKKMEIIETPCHHVFHAYCLQKWVKNKVECPICRGKIVDVVEDLESFEDNTLNL